LTRRHPTELDSSSVTPWLQVTETVEGTTCADPGGLVTSSSFDGDLFEIVTTNVATVVDGYRENTPDWSVNLLARYPDFDPLTDLIESWVEFVSIPSAGTAKVGIYHGLFDTPTRASRAGFACGMTDNAAGAHQQSSMGTASVTYNGATSTVTSAMWTRFAWDQNRTGQDTTRWRTSAGLWTQSDRNGIRPSLGATLADWRLVYGIYRLAAGAAVSSTLQWRAYTRKVTLGAPP
jgi:hypothetical protein